MPLKVFWGYFFGLKQINLCFGFRFGTILHNKGEFMSKKAMPTKIVKAKQDGEKLLQEKEEITQKEEKAELSAKSLMGLNNKPEPDLAPKQEEWKQNLVVKFDKVSLQFTKEYFALFEVSFEGKEGERIAIYGENECGKTSILRILAALEQPYSGSAKIRNKKISSKLFAKDVMLGFMPENPALLMRKTVLDNMIYAKRIREKKTKTDADVASGMLFDLGLINLKASIAGKLSYFEKQCIALARYKFRNLELLLIDAIFDNMTEEETASFFDLLNKVVLPNTLIIFSTTDIVLAKRYASRIIKLENGSLSE